MPGLAEDAALSPEDLTQVEIELLQALVTEPSMAHVARRIGYSQRQTRRLVQGVVHRLGAPNKYGAVAIAAAHGAVALPTPSDSQSDTQHPPR